jgi:hypothetical protein
MKESVALRYAASCQGQALAEACPKVEGKEREDFRVRVVSFSDDTAFASFASISMRFAHDHNF